VKKKVKKLKKEIPKKGVRIRKNKRVKKKKKIKEKKLTQKKIIIIMVLH